MALDAAELERLFVTLEAPLYNVVFRWLWNADEASDAVQEAFVRLWDMRARVRVETAKALVYRIALNVAAKRRRARKLWRWVSLDFASSVASSEASSETHSLAAEERARVQRALDALPEPLRQVITLCELTELSYDEVAEVLAIPVGTVGSRRHAALKKLERALGKITEVDDAPG